VLIENRRARVTHVPAISHVENVFLLGFIKLETHLYDQAPLAQAVNVRFEICNEIL
jgi:hypothetical protein